MSIKDLFSKSKVAIYESAESASVDLESADFLKKKVEDNNTWINGGYFILSKDIFDNINGDECSFEIDVLPAPEGDDSTIQKFLLLKTKD